MRTLEDLIRTRAYEIWQAGGAGDAQEQWLQAEREVTEWVQRQEEAAVQDLLTALIGEAIRQHVRMRLKKIGRDPGEPVFRTRG